jgi:hypothetical protein
MMLESFQHRRQYSVGTDLGIDILEVSQPVRGILRVSYIIICDKLITPGRQQDTVHQVGKRTGVVLLISLIPVCRDIIRRLASGKYLACDKLATRLVVLSGVIYQIGRRPLDVQPQCAPPSWAYWPA